MNTLLAEVDPADWMGLHPIDWIVLVGYFIVIMGIGIYSYLKVSDMSDYFMGGRRFGKVFMMFFAFGSGTSSEQAVSVAAGSFRFGLAGIWYQFLWLIATPFYWIIAPVFRRMRALTTSDFFEARYNSSTATLYSALGILISVVFIAGGLFGAGAMIEGLAGGINPATGDPFFPKEYAIGAMTIMFVMYGFAGGLGAAIITDFLQGILTIVFSFLLLPFALVVAANVAGTEGGFEALHKGVPNFSGEEMLSLTIDEEFAQKTGNEPITPFFVMMLSISGLIGIVVQPHIMGVCGAGKTEMEGRVGFTFGNFIKRFCTIAWSFTGLACIVIYLTPENGYITDVELAAINESPDAFRDFADQVFGRAAHDILPTISHGLVGLLMAALLAAVMSTCDAQMVVGAGLFTENIYRRFMVKKASKTHYLWVGRLASLGIVALALAMLTQFDNVIQVLTRYIQALPAFIGLSFWIGLLWRRFSPAAVWVSTVITAGVWYLTQTHKPLDWMASMGGSEFLQQNIDYFPSMVRHWLAEIIPSVMNIKVTEAGEFLSADTRVPYQMAMYLSLGAISGIVTSFLSKPTPKEKLDHFYKLIRTPITPGEHVDIPCTLPENPAPMETRKLINHPDWEIPYPSRIGMIGFLGSWVMVAFCIGLLYFLRSLGT
ncbi:MAG: sodium:solute symporter family protein [Planctomycetaceae bacterium]|nr:sodium:solute symporter family protein [Planctomycetaceae bacterium]